MTTTKGEAFILERLRGVGGKLLVVGATPDRLVFMQPESAKKGKDSALGYRQLIPQGYNYNWGLELSDDLKTVGVATEYGVLVIDLSDFIR